MISKKKPSLAPLRRIAVHVDEPEPGWFAWALTEAEDEGTTWTQIDHTDEWVRSYKDAMAAGLLVLQGMVADLDSGPRNEPTAEATKVRRGNVFGFGFGTNLS